MKGGVIVCEVLLTNFERNEGYMRTYLSLLSDYPSLTFQVDTITF